MRERAGIRGISEGQKTVNPLRPIAYMRCHAVSVPGSRFFNCCGFPLTEMATADVAQLISADEQTEEYAGAYRAATDALRAMQ